MSAILTCLATNLICCCSNAACHLCNTSIKPTSSVATRAAYAVFFLSTALMAWTLQTGWLDRALAKLPTYPFDLYDCPDGNCFSGNYAVARVMLALAIFHAVFALGLIGVKTSRDFRAGIQNGWWGPKILALSGLTVAMFFIPNSFFHPYSIVAFIGATLFIFIQLVILIDFAATWSQSWVGKWEETESKMWLALLLGTGIFFAITVLAVTIVMYVIFCKSGCGLNIFFVTFNLALSLLAFGLSVSKPVQEARPDSGILQAGMVALYATYLLVSGLSGETFPEGELNCNPFSSGTQQLATVLGTIFTLVAIAYSASRAATKSKVLLGDGEVPKTHTAAGDDSVLPLIINEAPAPTRTMTEAHPSSATSATQEKPPQDPSQPPASHIGAGLTPPKTDPATATTPASPAAKNSDQELIEIGVMPDSKSKRRHLEESVASGALPKSVLDEADVEEAGTGKQQKKAKKGDVESQGGNEGDEDEEDDDDHKGLVREDEKEGCHYNYSYYHVIFCLAAMYVTMLINGWSTVNDETGELISVGHDWASVWVKVVSSWVCVLLYVWTLVAPILFPNRDWN